MDTPLEVPYCLQKHRYRFRSHLARDEFVLHAQERGLVELHSDAPRTRRNLFCNG
jgi:hypothetical protein